ncbi:putative reverse transcriptase domain-containing protein [Tanacetum coccineum]
MAEPLSPDNVFDFHVDDPTLDVEDPDIELDEDPEEEPKEDSGEEPEEDPEEVIPHVVASPSRSPRISPPPLLESSLDSDIVAPVTANGASWVPHPGSIFKVGGPSPIPSPLPYLLDREVKRLREDTKTLYGSVRTLEQGMRTRQTEIATIRYGVDRIRRRMDAFDVDLAFIEQDSTRVSDDVLALQEDRARDWEENRRLKIRLDELEASNTLAAMDRERLEREFFNMRVWVSRQLFEVMGRGAMEARPSLSIDVLVVYEDSKHSELQGPPDDEAITEYKRNRANPEGARGAGAGNDGGGIAPKVRGCSYKTFLNCKPHSFNGTEGVVGLSCWFEKMESVFEISKFAKEDKVKYVLCTLKGRALTWWNRNVHSLGINAANQIPWNELKTMMTAEYCPRTKIQKMEQALWTLSMKGDDIDGYTNCFQ